MEERLKCNECGTRREEYEDDHNAYHVDTDRCIGCEKIAWEQHAWSEGDSKGYGLKFHLVKANTESPVRVPIGRPTSK